MGEFGILMDDQRGDGGWGQESRGEFGSSKGRRWGKLRGEFAMFVERIWEELCKIEE